MSLSPFFDQNGNPVPGQYLNGGGQSAIGDILSGLQLEDGSTYRGSQPALYAGPEVDPSVLQQPGVGGDISPVAGVKKPGLMGRIMQQPGGSKALLAFGASLLSSPNFFDGLGKGAMAYQDTLDREEQRRLPKTQFLADGAYKAVIDPITGQVQMERTDVAGYNEGIQDKKLKSALAIAGLRDVGQTQRNLDTLGYRDRWERQDSEDKRYIADAGNKTDIEVAGIRAANALEVAKISGIGPGGGKPPPAAIQKQIGDYTDVRNGIENSMYAMGPIMQAIQGGKLNFGLASNLRHKASLATGVGGNDETVLYGQYQTMLESMRNALLIANKGVQTDGDADRAMAELIAGSGDTRSIQNNLNIVYRSLQRRNTQAQARIDELSNQYGADTSRSSPKGGGSGTTRSGVSWRIVN